MIEEKTRMPNLEAARRGLINTRARHGAETAPGYRCSNTVELLQTPPCPAHLVEYRDENGVQYFRNCRTDNIEKQTADLQRLLQASQ